MARVVVEIGRHKLNTELDIQEEEEVQVAQKVLVLAI